MPKRRLVAIMFTDIAGYTAMMQDSEEKTLSLRQTHREIFEPVTEKHRGEIIQYFGDGTLSIFESTFDAVNCGVELQQQFIHESIPTRIGIHVGEIILTENDIVGDAVNLASRVENIAIPGSVFITQKVQQELQNKDYLDFKSIGSIQFKNDKKERKIYAVKADGIHFPTKEQISSFKENPYDVKVTKNRKKRKLNLVAVTVVITVAVMGYYIYRSLKIKHVQQVVIPEIEALMEDINTVSTAGGTGANIWPAFIKYEQAEKYTSNDKAFEKLGKDIYQLVDITSDPPGFKIYARGYSHPDSEWRFLDVTPIKNVRLPYGFSRIKIEKEGHPTQYDILLNFIATGTNRQFNFKLPPKMSVPKDMAWIPGDAVEIEGESYFLDHFFMDEYEVTNEQYKEFVDAGGYYKKEYWDIDMDIDPDIFWNEVKSKFVDKTGQFGPSTWETGEYEKGKEKHPVAGVSWYEASAYAKFVNKELPSYYHFLRIKFSYDKLHRSVVECSGLSNFESNSTVEVGSSNAVLRFGINDLAGNVREWIQNDVFKENELQKYILGGGYDDFIYMMDNLTMTQNPSNRHITNGFRCIKSFDTDLPDTIFNMTFIPDENTDIERQPMSDEDFVKEIKRYKYDPSPFNDVIEYSRKEAEWTKSKIIFDPPYLGEKMIIYLYTPISTHPPHQIIIYWPGGNAREAPSYEEFGQEKQIEFLLKTGRAVVAPVLSASYERLEGKDAPWHSVLWEEIGERRIKDILRSIDYLCTMNNIDSSRIGYYGISWGANEGANILALEKRIKAAVLRVGGLADPKHYDYLPRISTPVLMLNGKLDPLFPYKTSQVPFYRLLGTKEPHKKLITYDAEHLIPKTEAIRETLNWFDEYLGPVDMLLN